MLKSIETQSRYTFFYNTKDIPLDRNVTLSVANKDIRAALDELFRNTNVSYSIDNKSIILSARGGAQPQQASQITGRIVDKNGVPVIGATIMISGTTQGTTSGVDGTFALQSNVSPAGMILDVSFIGYKPQRISVNNRTSLSVTLEEDDQQIEAVVVTALGIKRQERAVSYNVQNISDEVFLTRDANMVNSLAGKIAGVTINASAAGVGGETKVVMRGSKSIAGSNNALYVLDGIPLPSLSLTNPGDEFTIMRENNLTGDGISNFNPDDIESMSILSGATASALYGAQGANGVILITTKKGAPHKGPQIVFEGQWAYESPATKFNLMNGRDYLLTLRPAIAEGYCGGADPLSILDGAESAGAGNSAASRWTTRYLNPGESLPKGYKWIEDPVNPGKIIVFQDNDQQSQWFDDAFWQNYYIGVNGGGETFKFRSKKRKRLV